MTTDTRTQHTPGPWQTKHLSNAGPPCIRPRGHNGAHRDADGFEWVA